MARNDDDIRVHDIRDYISDSKMPEIWLIPEILDYEPTDKTLFYELKKKEVVEEGFKRFIYELNLDKSFS